MPSDSDLTPRDREALRTMPKSERSHRKAPRLSRGVRFRMARQDMGALLKRTAIWWLGLFVFSFCWAFMWAAAGQTESDVYQVGGGIAVMVWFGYCIYMLIAFFRVLWFALTARVDTI